MVSKLPRQTNRTASKIKKAATKESSPPSLSSREKPTPQTSSNPFEHSAPSFFLRTKLLPPRPAPSRLTRPRLLERLEANLPCSVTLVTANAGSGKTTLVADFVRAHQHPFVWYQLDRTDADPGVFLSYIAHGLGLKVSGFGEATLAYLRQAATEVAAQPERAADIFINEILDCVERQIIIVLDDYHLLGSATPVHRMVDRLLAYLPEVLHVIIISRDVPPLSLARLRTQNALAIIDRLDLLFTDTEIQQLFHDVFGLSPSPVQLAEYRERTHGWITALQLVYQVAQRRHRQQPVSPATADLSEILRQSEHDIFNFFAEQVFALETPEVQNFLMRISLLDGVQPEVCAYLSDANQATTGETNCAPLLVELVRRNVFITLASDEREAEEYRLHPMFQTFLRKRFSVTVGARQVARQHTSYADFYLTKNRWEQAFQHLTIAENFDRAAELLAAHGASWLSAGALSTLAASAASLPASSLAAHPRAIVHQAEVARLRGELPFAQSLFRRASMLLREHADTEGEAEALHSLAAIARRQGNYDEAHHHLDAAIALSDERSHVQVKCGNTRGACFVAQNRWTDAEVEFRHALRLAEELGDEHYARLIAHNLGMPAVLRGDFDEALRWLHRLLPNENQASSTALATTHETTIDKRRIAPVPQEATAHLNIARCHLYRGDFVLCERHLDAALEGCQQFNLLALRGEIFETYGALYRKQNQPERATEAYERAARLYEETGTDISRRELIEEQAMLAMQNGDTESARSMLERLAVKRRAHGDEWLIHSTSLALGRVLLAEGNHTEAEKLLLGALEFFRQHELNYTEAQTRFALAGCFFHLGDEAAMVLHLTRALELAARYNYGYWLKREVMRAHHLFTTNPTLNLLPPDARESLRESLSFAHASVAQSQTPLSSQAPPKLLATAGVSIVALPSPVDLTINLLGHIEIMREPARPFAADAWVTKRARDILCFIASRKHRRASKDVIQDTFWGESDFDHIEKNFHPTISHIRKALNSNQPLKQNFLLFRDGDYQLNPELSYRIDLEDFDRLVEQGEAALRARHAEEAVESFERATQLYRGEFMQGFYDDWINEQRSYYRAQHLRIAKTLIAARQKNGQWAHSLQLANAILRDDPFHEDVHCMVMHAHAALGDRLAVKEQYDTITRILREELGIEPGIETKRTFHELFK